MYSKVVVVRNPSGLHARLSLCPRLRIFSLRLVFAVLVTAVSLETQSPLSLCFQWGLLRVMPWNSWLMVPTSGRRWSPYLI